MYQAFFGSLKSASDGHRPRRRRSILKEDILGLSEGSLKLPALPGWNWEAIRSADDYSKIVSNLLLSSQAIDRKTLVDAVKSFSPLLKFLPEKGLMFQLLADNPQLLLDPEFRRVIGGFAEAAGRNELDKYLAGSDPVELMHLFKVGFFSN